MNEDKFESIPEDQYLWIIPINKIATDGMVYWYGVGTEWPNLPTNSVESLEELLDTLPLGEPS